MIDKTFKLFAFIVLSAVLIAISRASLRKPGSHGFYRFFAWEFILVLVLLNLDAWFREPLSARQLVSWFFLLVSLGLVISGVYALRAYGNPSEKRAEQAGLIGIEKTTSLVTAGIYKYIRHPLYSSLLFFTWGVFIKKISWAGFACALAATFFLVVTAKIDEAECAHYFGPAYQAYIEKTRMFIPFLI